jgi:hypothetical protein
MIYSVGGMLGALVLLAGLLEVFGQNDSGSSASFAPTVDGIPCAMNMATNFHIHAHLGLYINGQRMTIAGTQPGIVTSGNQTCYYYLHVHSETPNIIHVEAPFAQTFALGQFFDVWGAPLSRAQVLDQKADASHLLTFVTFDQAGKMTTVTGDPRAIQLTPHETIFILYNSPNVHPTPNTDWTGVP